MALMASGKTSGTGGGVADAPPRRRAAGYLRWLVLLLPSIVAVAYFGMFASNRYVSEAQFVVRTASKPISAGAFGAILQMSGLSRSSDDVYAVQSFMTSRDAVDQLLEKLPLRDFYARPGVDAWSRYPNIVYRSSIEHLQQYLKWMITPDYNATTGILTLRVQAFRAQDAKAIADQLMRLGEQTVNRMNNRIREDAQRSAREEVKRNEQRLINSQIAITRFRVSELMIDAASSSIIVTELVARLSAELSRIEAQMRETQSSAPNSPSVGAQQRRAAALQAQIDKERAKIADDSGGLAVKLAQYERLVLEREFAKTALSASVKGLDSARNEARRQQLYLEQIVRPHVPDFPMLPERLRMIWTAVSLNLVGLLVVWLLYSGITEHNAT